MVFDPVRHEYCFAEAGQGAFVNDRRLRVSGRRHMANSLFATGIPFLGHGDAASNTRFGKELQKVMAVSVGVRRLDQLRSIWLMLPPAAMMAFGNAA